jgi:glycosyltransferase involved in cell wall biosynthesis
MQMDVLGGLACLLTGATWIVREPNSRAAYLGSWKFRAREVIARGADAIVCNSEAGRRYWSDFFPRKRICVVRNALPLQDTGRTTAVPPEALALKAGIPIVLYAGRLVGDHTSDKNLKRLLMAAKDVLQVMDLQIVLCGDGPQRQELRRLAESMGLGERVKLMGHVEKELLWALMKTAEVFVSVSHFEGMPNSVMEAMAVGCPLVVSDIEAHRELLTEDMALFVPVDDAGLIARALLECLRDRPGAHLRAESARRKTSEWMIEIMVQRYEDMYHDVIEGKMGGTWSGCA